jgi:hypothetical protein
VQRIAICSEAMRTRDSGVYRVLLTVMSQRDPEYVLINLMNVRSDELLKQGKTYRITIEEEGECPWLALQSLSCG